MSENGGSGMTSGPVQRKIADSCSNGPLMAHKYIFKLHLMLAIQKKYRLYFLPFSFFLFFYDLHLYTFHCHKEGLTLGSTKTALVDRRDLDNVFSARSFGSWRNNGKSWPYSILALYHEGLHRWWPAPWMVPGSLLRILHVTELQCYTTATGNSKTAHITVFWLSFCFQVLFQGNPMYNTSHNLSRRWVKCESPWGSLPSLGIDAVGERNQSVQKPSQPQLPLAVWAGANSQGGTTNCVTILTGKYTPMHN